MRTNILHRFASLPVVREVLGAAAGCGVALALYGIFEFVRGILGSGSIDVVGPLHAAAGAVVAHGAVSLGVALPLALAGGCAFVHTHMTSEID